MLKVHNLAGHSGIHMQSQQLRGKSSRIMCLSPAWPIQQDAITK
jgi:hypothetical protein